MLSVWHSKNTQIRLTLSAPSTQAEPIDVTLEGRATIQGRAVAHPAVPAEDMMQAFAYRHLVTAQELKVVVNNRWMPRTSIRLLGESPVRIPAGGTVTVQVATPSSGFSERVRLELSDPPEGITIKDVSVVAAIAGMVGSVVGYIAANAQQVVGYFFGSSAGSSSKTDAMGDAVSKLVTATGSKQ